MIVLATILSIAAWIGLSVKYDLGVHDSRIGFWFLIYGLCQIISLIYNTTMFVLQYFGSN